MGGFKTVSAKHAATGRGAWRVSTLVRRALAASTEQSRWKCVVALHRRGTREVLESAVDLCRSRSPKQRELGADVLGQLGVPNRTFPDEALDTLHPLVRLENNPRVLGAALVAIGHAQDQNDRRGIRPICRLAGHEDDRVRFGVVMALLGREDHASIGALITLSDDPDDEVRDWATFGLGTQVDVNTPRLRRALSRRINDPHQDTREEAIVGLARRCAPEIRAVLIDRLTGDEPTGLDFEAASEFGDPGLRNHLEEHLRRARREGSVDRRWLDSLTEAIARLRPNPEGLEIRAGREKPK